MSYGVAAFDADIVKQLYPGNPSRAGDARHINTAGRSELNGSEELWDARMAIEYDARTNQFTPSYSLGAEAEISAHIHPSLETRRWAMAANASASSFVQVFGDDEVNQRSTDAQDNVNLAPVTISWKISRSSEASNGFDDSTLSAYLYVTDNSSEYNSIYVRFPDITSDTGSYTLDVPLGTTFTIESRIYLLSFVSNDFPAQAESASVSVTVSAGPTKTIPRIDLSAPGASYPTDSSGFRWSDRDLTSFVFDYGVTRTGNGEPNASTIGFYWSSTADRSGILSSAPAYSYTLSGNAIQQGSHGPITVTREQMAIPAPLSGAKYLVMIVDPGSDPKVASDGRIFEENERNNLSALRIVPSVIAIVTHGALPDLSTGEKLIGNDLYGPALDQAQFRQFAAQIQNLPPDGSELDGRVDAFAPAWESTKEFSTALALGLLNEALNYDIPIPRSNKLVDILRGLSQYMDTNTVQSYVFSELIEHYSSLARKRALATAARIRDEVEGIEAYSAGQGLDYASYLDPALSNRLQRIVLIGQGRGAGVNALVAKMLQKDGYYNIEEQFLLDGFSTEWGQPFDALSDVSFKRAYLARRNVNVQVDQSYWGTQGFPFSRYEGGKSPALNGFENELVNEGSSVVSDQFNVDDLFFSSNGLIDSSFIASGVFPRRESTSSSPPRSPASRAALGETVNSESVMRDHDWGFGFAQGDFASLWGLLEAVKNIQLQPTGDPEVDEQIRLLFDPDALFDAEWDRFGDVRLESPGVRMTTSNGAASLGSEVVFPDRVDGLDVEFTVDHSDPGDVLEVLLDGAVQDVASSLDVSTLTGSQRVTIPLYATQMGSFANVSLRLRGTHPGSADVLITRMALHQAENHTPVLGTTTPTFGAIDPTNNAGILVADLLAGSQDADYDNLGIAITGFDGSRGRLQFSFDEGRTWRDVGVVTSQSAFLVAGDDATRVRFVPYAGIFGRIDNALEFKVWDGSTGLDWVDGQYADTTDTGTPGAYSAESARASAIVVQAHLTTWDAAIPKAIVAGATWTVTLPEIEGFSAASYEVTGLPANATFNSETGVLSWTPSASQAGTTPFRFSITARGVGEPVTRENEIQIVGGNDIGRFFRAYNPIADYHFFTVSPVEFSAAVSAGYRDESTGTVGFDVLSHDVPGASPIYRLYNLQTGRHYYTFSSAERDYLVSLVPPPSSGPDTRSTGWRMEKVDGHIFGTQQPGTVEVSRLYNQNSGVHLLTDNPSVRDAVLAIEEILDGVPTGRHPWQLHSSFGFAVPGSLTPSSMSSLALGSASSEPVKAAALPMEMPPREVSTLPGSEESELARLVVTVASPVVVAPPKQGDVFKLVATGNGVVPTGGTGLGGVGAGVMVLDDPSAPVAVEEDDAIEMPSAEWCDEVFADLDLVAACGLSNKWAFEPNRAVACPA